MSSWDHAGCPNGKKEQDRRHKEWIIAYLEVYSDAGKTELAGALDLGRKRLDRLLFEMELDGMIDRKGSLQRPRWCCPVFPGRNGCKNGLEKTES